MRKVLCRISFKDNNLGLNLSFEKKHTNSVIKIPYTVYATYQEALEAMN